MGMAAVVIGFVGLFRDIGTSSAIIQRRDIDDGLLTVAVTCAMLGTGVRSLVMNVPVITAVSTAVALWAKP